MEVSQSKTTTVESCITVSDTHTILGRGRADRIDRLALERDFCINTGNVKVRQTIPTLGLAGAG